MKQEGKDENKKKGKETKERGNKRKEMNLSTLLLLLLCCCIYFIEIIGTSFENVVEEEDENTENGIYQTNDPNQVKVLSLHDNNNDKNDNINFNNYDIIINEEKREEDKNSDDDDDDDDDKEDGENKNELSYFVIEPEEIIIPRSSLLKAKQVRGN